MNILTNPLPKKIQIGKTEVEVETDFRFFINYEIEMFHSGNSVETIIKFLTDFYKGVMHEDADKMVEEFNKFYLGGGKTNGKASKGSSNVKAYYYDFDAEYIYSAFLDQYKIDIVDIEYIHWHKFLSLFKSLKPDCKISEIMGYRVMKIDSKMSAEQKKFYKSMKSLYAPPRSDAEIAYQDNLNKMIDEMRGK